MQPLGVALVIVDFGFNELEELVILSLSLLFGAAFVADSSNSFLNSSNFDQMTSLLSFFFWLNPLVSLGFGETSGSFVL